MPALLDASEGSTTSVTHTPWLQQYRFGNEFWKFFWAAFCFDCGFGIYYFLFNLYLLNLQFHERSIGLINGAHMLGSVLCTLPAGWLGRKYGVRPVMLVCFVAAPMVSVLRTFAPALWSQSALAVLGGGAVCLWHVSYLPAVARLTEERNRAAAFSLIFSASVGSSALGGALCAHLPVWLASEGFIRPMWEMQRSILIGAALLASLGLVFVWKLQLPNDAKTEEGNLSGWRHVFESAFLRRYVLIMAVWSAIIAAFAPFANVYLTNSLHLSLGRIGTVFLMSQLLQLVSGLITAPLFRLVGLRPGIAMTQVLSGLLLLCMALIHRGDIVTGVYLCFSAAQWMCSPGMYNLLMRGTPDRERSTAASVVMFCNALISSGATAIAGIGFASMGYAWMFVLLGLVALGVSVCTVTLLRTRSEATG